MKEYVLVEFYALLIDAATLMEKILSLNEDFKMLGTTNDSEGLSYRVTGQITSEYASVIKLQDKFLSERMRISYIPEDLKNKYRT